MLFFALVTCAPVAAEAEGGGAAGTVCIATFSEADRNTGGDTGGTRPLEQVTYLFSVQFDDGPRTNVPASEPVAIALTTGQRHLVRIFDGDRLIESFHFTFESRGSTYLCLSYGDYYQTWQLEPPLPAAKWCRCAPPSQGK